MGVPGPSGSRTSAISRFLAEHQDHDAGFDVGREAGSGTGRLRVVCLGCGASVEYRAADAESVAATRAQLEDRVSPPRERERGSPQRPAGGRATRRPETSGPPLRTIGIGILIASALVVAGILLLSGGGSSGDSKGSTSPAVATVSTRAPQPAAQPAPPPPKPQPRAPRLHPTTFADRVSIGVPGGWQSEQRGSETVLTGPGGSPEINAYFAEESHSLADLGSSAVDFLKDRHPDGHVTVPHPTHIAGIQALQVEATFGPGSETAVVLTSGAFAYLLVKRIEGGDQPFRVRQATAALDSFRPL